MNERQSKRRLIRAGPYLRTLACDRSILLLPLIILAFLLLSSAVSFSLMGFQVTGWSWFAGLIVACVVVARSSKRPELPAGLWAAWFALVTIYSFAGFDNAYQSAAQILSPILVGVAASTLRPRESDLRRLLHMMRVGGVIFLGIILILRLPMLLLGRLPEVTGLAAEGISSLLFQSLFLCAYLVEHRKTDLVLYLCFAAVPVIAVTRGPILGSFLLLVLVLAPLPMRFRITLTVLALGAGLAVFHTERVQRKMFQSGQGNLRDLAWDNPNLAKSGRQALWDVLSRGIADKPWFGHGGNADAAALIRGGFGTYYLPHNDWLRVLYNYGRAGCAVYILTMLAQLIHGVSASRRAPPAGRIFFFASLSAFIPYATLMLFDNILIYAQFFGNLHFLLLGLAYGSLHASKQIPGPFKPVNSNARSLLRARRIMTRRPRPVGLFPGRRLSPLAFPKHRNSPG